jgi:hypothetical protein
MHTRYGFLVISNEELETRLEFKDVKIVLAGTCLVPNKKAYL